MSFVQEQVIVIVIGSNSLSQMALFFLKWHPFFAFFGYNYTRRAWDE